MSNIDDVVANLYIVRGLPGSGKTTLAQKIGCLVVNPWDDISTKKGKYLYDPSNENDVMCYCHDIVKMAFDYSMDIAICDVFLKKSTIQKIFTWTYHHVKYVQDFKNFGLHVTDLKISPEQSHQRNIHHCSIKTIQDMNESFEPWKEEDYMEAWIRRNEYIKTINKR